MPMNRRDYDELIRIHDDRNAKTELAFQACAALINTFSGVRVPPESSLYPAYTLAKQALGLEPL